MKRYPTRLLLFGTGILVSVLVRAQLVLSNTLTPQQVVQTVLLGPGVSASNIQFSGQIGQLATFNSTTANVGINTGVMLCTGSTFMALGPNDESGATLPAGGYNGPGDPDLDDLINTMGVTSHDRAILEFDFVPNGDSLKFKFVFASEEYIEFVNSINDAFGFFLSGPGISGPYLNNAANIALIPGTTQPVTINSVNNLVNTAFYIDNGDGFTAPYNGSNTYIQFDGKTTVITAEALVVCGQTYHIKIAIGDASDSILDSGVFLEAGSFQSNAVSLSTQINAGGQDSTIYEGCGVATLFLSRAGDLSTSESVQFITGGVAVAGTDYNSIPGTFTFQPGQDSIQVTITATLDGLTEGPELVELLAIASGNCGVDSTYLHFYIDDAPAIDLVMSNDTVLQCNDSVFVSGVATGGYGTLVLDWNAGIADGTTGAWVAPAATTTYTLTVTDDCGVVTETGSVTVTIPIPAPLVVQALPDTTVYCPESAIALSADVQGGTLPYAYQWTGGLGAAATANVAPPVTQSWSVTITDQCGLVATDAVTVTVLYDTINVITSVDTSICKSDTANLSAVASSGTGAYTYVWSNGVIGDRNPITPSATSTYMVTATDECGISATDDITVVVNAPVAAFSYTGSVYVTNFPIQFLDESADATTWSWDFGLPGLTSTEPYPVVSFDSDGFFTVMLAIMDGLGCVDTTYRTILIDPELQFYAPNTFTPDADDVNDVFFGNGVGLLTYHMRIFDRWGEVVRETEELYGSWDGTVGGVEAPTGVYTYWFRIQAISGEVQEHMGHVTLVR
ncbi:MAG: choice-of-anchor L domain-containing protein [Flavobacteriales bacterium]